ncbi:MAG: hypothetical protein IPQ13_00015 [Holophagaceae bacterium]|nr:hypothetical protein [Holophagaceae bacterium]
MTPPAQLMKARGLMERRSSREAQSELRRLLQVDPKIQEASRMLEMVQHKAGRPEPGPGASARSWPWSMDELMQTHLESSARPSGHPRERGLEHPRCHRWEPISS